MSPNTVWLVFKTQEYPGPRDHFLNLIFVQVSTVTKMVYVLPDDCVFKFTLAKLLEMVECPELELFDWAEYPGGSFLFLAVSQGCRMHRLGTDLLDWGHPGRRGVAQGGKWQPFRRQRRTWEMEGIRYLLLICTAKLNLSYCWYIQKLVFLLKFHTWSIISNSSPHFLLIILFLGNKNSY